MVENVLRCLVVLIQYRLWRTASQPPCQTRCHS